MNKRILLRKKADFQVKSESLMRSSSNLGLSTLKSIRIVQVYDVFDLAEDLKHHIFSEQFTTDHVWTACRRILPTMLLPCRKLQGSLTSVQLLHRK